MNKFSVGMICGVIGLGSIAATPTDPCMNWKVDAVLYEACLLTACDGDRQKVANIKALYGRAWGIHNDMVGIYEFEIDKNANFKRNCDEIGEILLPIAFDVAKKAKAEADKQVPTL